MTANVHAVDLGAGAIFSLQLTGLSIGEADFFKSLAGTITRDRIELPQHSNHEVILDAAMQLCDKFGKDDPEYTTAWAPKASRSTERRRSKRSARLISLSRATPSSFAVATAFASRVCRSSSSLNTTACLKARSLFSGRSRELPGSTL